MTSSAEAGSECGSGSPSSGAGPFEIVAIGASFGGPKAIECVLGALPQGFFLPIVICQHITPGMTGIWAQMLTGRSSLSVSEAVDGCELLPGTAHIAPAGLQMRVVSGSRGPRVRMDHDFADSLHVPAIDVLFSSAAKAFGSRTIAVLLTGMGRDGTSGMVQIRHAGGYTIGESECSAMSYSMPGSAVEAGGVVEQLPLERIASRIVELGARNTTWSGR